MNSEITVENSLTIPNGITIFRLIIGMFGLWIVQNADENLSQVVVGISLFISIGMACDWLDGYLARKYGWESQLGALLDPMADKIIFYSSIFLLFVQFTLLFIFIPLFMCDLISTVLYIKNGGKSNRNGKKKYMSQCVAIIIFFLVWLATQGYIQLSDASITEDIVIANAMLLIALIFSIGSLRKKIVH